MTHGGSASRHYSVPGYMECLQASAGVNRYPDLKVCKYCIEIILGLFSSTKTNFLYQLKG